MLKTIGDYYSTMPVSFALPVALIVIVILLIVIVVGLRRQKVARDKARRLARYITPTKARSTFVASERMRYITPAQERHIQSAARNQKEDAN